jgi:hypothetical protein
MFDRHGPDAALMLRAVPFALITFACLWVLFSTLERKIGYPDEVVVPLAGLFTGVVCWMGMRFASAMGEGVGHFLMPSGNSTPYEHQYSLEESLAERGDVVGALDRLETAMVATPIEGRNGISLRIRAAELYMGKGSDPKRAAELFREVQRYPAATATQDIYVSNRLIDLLLGPLDQPARALVELRRIADRYPESAAATHARSAIVTIKRRIEETGSGRRSHS